MTSATTAPEDRSPDRVLAIDPEVYTRSTTGVPLGEWTLRRAGQAASCATTHDLPPAARSRHIQPPDLLLAPAVMYR
jgi:hypothetical protein